MPIRLPSNLPAYSTLKHEGVMVLDEESAARQDIRPLKIALLNLMPKKIQTENQFARLIGATPLQIELSLIRMSEHKTKNTAADHMATFYRPFQEVKDQKFDGLIITGAPIEHLEFNDVTYWDELTEIFEWTQTHIHATLGVCWGAMAMINYFHNIPKYALKDKAFGCFRHQNHAPTSPYLRGFSDDFVIPVSRWTEVRQSDIAPIEGLETLVLSEETGPAIVDDPQHRSVYIFNHLEYDDATLKAEYDRDIQEGRSIKVPHNYYPNDDPNLTPSNRWRSHAHLFYGNWINQIYQTTPFDLNHIGANS